ncbi:MAG: right-handed parallel beta-helix repeat-containing protein [Clostridiales bacterium]|jgi:hypothetical protein|nr:right-handed parallel beta-helix repeat-containing protein [Clostridiales bacterium]
MKIRVALLWLVCFALAPIGILAGTPSDASPYLRAVEIVSVTAEGNFAEVVVKNNGAAGRYLRISVSVKEESGAVTAFGGTLTVLRPGAERKVKIVSDGFAGIVSEVSAQVSAGDAPVKFYVATDGDDANNGSLSAPFRTIDRAKDEVRRLKHAFGLPYGGATVYIRGGSYTMNQTLSFDARDAGFADSPVVYAAYNGEKVTVNGAYTLPPEAFVPANHIAAGVLRADLNALGITDFGEVTRSNAFTVASDTPSSTMLYADGQPQTLARYPNDGVLKTGAVTPASAGEEWTTEFAHNFGFDPAEKWRGEDVWTRGFWRWNWYEDALRAAVTSDKVRLGEKTAYGVAAGQEYYFYNILSELDAPGEFYIDRTGGFLYYYPPAGALSPGTSVTLTFLRTPIIAMKNAGNLRFEGLELADSRSSGVLIEDCENVVIEGCTLRGLGGQGVRILGGKNCGVLSGNIYNIGRGGVRLEGGDRATLTAGGHFVENCDIYDFCLESATYTPAIYFTNAGNIARNNRIHSGPHMGIALSGNDHLIENNEFYDLCRNSDDAGAIYGGRDWTQCGNVIRGNYFHDIYGKNGRGAHAVYLDDMLSGNTVSDNIFYNVYSAVFMHGGRNTTVSGNTVIDAEHSVWQRNIQNFDTYALPGGTLRSNYRAMFTEDDAARVSVPPSEAWRKYDAEPTAEFPFYRRLDKIPWDQPNYPKYNEFTGNTLYRSGRISVTAYAEESGVFGGNAEYPQTLEIGAVNRDGIGVYADQWRESEAAE